MRSCNGQISMTKVYLPILKKIPESPPEIKISVDNINLNYIVETIRWDGVKYKRNDPCRKILDEDLYIPNFKIV